MTSYEDSSCGNLGGQSPVRHSRIPCPASSAARERQVGPEKYSAFEAAADILLEDESPPSDFDWIGDLSMTDSSCVCPEGDESATNQPARQGSPILSQTGRRISFSPGVTSTPKSKRCPAISRIPCGISNISSIHGSPTSSRTGLNESQREKMKKQLKEVEEYYNLPLEAWQKEPGSQKPCPAASKSPGRQSSIPLAKNVCPGTSRRISFSPRAQISGLTSPGKQTISPGASKRQTSPRTHSLSPVPTRKPCPGSSRAQSASPTRKTPYSPRPSRIPSVPTGSPKPKYVYSSVSDETSGDRTTCSCSEEALKKGLQMLSGDVPGKSVSLGIKKPARVTADPKKQVNPMMKCFMKKSTEESKTPSSSKPMYSFYTSGDIEALRTGISDTSEEQVPCPGTSQSPCRSRIPQLASPTSIPARARTPKTSPQQPSTSQANKNPCCCPKPSDTKTVCSPPSREREMKPYQGPKAGPSCIASESAIPSGDSAVSDECPAREEWTKTQEDLTAIDRELKKATEAEVRKVMDTLGPAADQYDIMEALCAAGIPDSVIEREMVKMDVQSTMDEQELEDLKFFEQVEQLIDEETKDIDIALLLYREEIEARRRRGESPRIPTLGLPETRKRYTLRGQLRQMHKQVRPYTIVEGDEPEDIQPEVAAAMMHTEEIGLHLGNAPDQLFSYLFKEKAGISVCPKVDVMPGEAEGLAVPGKMSAIPEGNLMVAPVQQPPSTDVYSENVGSAPVVADQPAETSKTQESAASVASDLGPGIDYFLEATPPMYYTRVQLRGSVPPDWFPGFLEAMPYRVRLNSSPSQVMQQSWYFVHPENYKPKDVKVC